MNWDSIKYIFQIPLDWYKKIHKRVFNAYGTNFITVREGFYGGTEVGVDSDGFAAEVERAIDLSDYVKTVNEIGPDENGDVDLGDIVHSVNNQTPDSNGNVDLGDIVHSVNGETPDSNGNVSINVGVKTVNNTSPDSNGNINVSADTSTCLKKSDWMNVSSSYSVCPYYYANAGYTGNLPNAVTNIYTYTGMMSYADLDSYITALGYVKSTTLSDYVLSSDLTTTLADYVLSSDLTTTLADYVLSSDLTTTLADYVLSSDLTTTLADYVQESDLGDLAYMDGVIVDGHVSDQNGEVSFRLTPSKWVKTDASGHLTTTNDTPIAVDTSQYTPVNATNQKVVTDVTWNGTKLQYKYQNWTFVNGVLVSKSNEATQDIDTPTVISWA